MGGFCTAAGGSCGAGHATGGSNDAGPTYLGSSGSSGASIGCTNRLSNTTVSDAVVSPDVKSGLFKVGLVLLGGGERGTSCARPPWFEDELGCTAGVNLTSGLSRLVSLPRLFCSYLICACWKSDPLSAGGSRVGAGSGEGSG